MDAPNSNIRPLWIPDNVDFDTLPVVLQLALVEVIGPAYDEFVVHALNALDRAEGMRYCHHLWIMSIDMVRLGHLSANAMDASGCHDDYERVLNQYIRLSARLEKSSRFLLDLRRAALLFIPRAQQATPILDSIDAGNS